MLYPFILIVNQCIIIPICTFNVLHEVVMLQCAQQTTEPLWTESPEVQKRGLKVLLFIRRIYSDTKKDIVSVLILT